MSKVHRIGRRPVGWSCRRAGLTRSLRCRSLASSSAKRRMPMSQKRAREPGLRPSLRNFALQIAHFIGLHIPTERALKSLHSLKGG